MGPARSAGPRRRILACDTGHAEIRSGPTTPDGQMTAFEDAIPREAGRSSVLRSIYLGLGSATVGGRSRKEGVSARRIRGRRLLLRGSAEPLTQAAGHG